MDKKESPGLFQPMDFVSYIEDEVLRFYPGFPIRAEIDELLGKFEWAFELYPNWTNPKILIDNAMSSGSYYVRCGQNTFTYEIGNIRNIPKLAPQEYRDAIEVVTDRAFNVIGGIMSKYVFEPLRSNLGLTTERFIAKLDQLSAEFNMGLGYPEKDFGIVAMVNHLYGVYPYGGMTDALRNEYVQRCRMRFNRNLLSKDSKTE